jgi:hypothetical protein
MDPAGVANNVIPSTCISHINVKVSDVKKIENFIKT